MKKIFFILVICALKVYSQEPYIGQKYDTTNKVPSANRYGPFSVDHVADKLSFTDIINGIEYTIFTDGRITDHLEIGLDGHCYRNIKYRVGEYNITQIVCNDPKFSVDGYSIGDTIPILYRVKRWKHDKLIHSLSNDWFAHYDSCNVIKSFIKGIGYKSIDSIPKFSQKDFFDSFKKLDIPLNLTTFNKNSSFKSYQINLSGHNHSTQLYTDSCDLVQNFTIYWLDKIKPFGYFDIDKGYKAYIYEVSSEGTNSKGEKISANRFYLAIADKQGFISSTHLIYLNENNQRYIIPAIFEDKTITFTHLDIYDAGYGHSADVKIPKVMRYKITEKGLIEIR